MFSQSSGIFWWVVILIEKYWCSPETLKKQKSPLAAGCGLQMPPSSRSSGDRRGNALTLPSRSLNNILLKKQSTCDIHHTKISTSAKRGCRAEISRKMTLQFLLSTSATAKICSFTSNNSPWKISTATQIQHPLQPNNQRLMPRISHSCCHPAPSLPSAIQDYLSFIHYFSLCLLILLPEHIRKLCPFGCLKKYSLILSPWKKNDLKNLKFKLLSWLTQVKLSQ